MLLPSGVKIILPLVNTEPHTRFNRYERFGGIVITSYLLYLLPDCTSFVTITNNTKIKQ